MLLCLPADVPLAKKERLCQFQAFREARLSVILGEMLTATISVMVDYEFTNWNWQIDLCFYLSKNPSVNRAPAPAAPSKQTSAGRRGRACYRSMWRKHCNNVGQANYWMCITKLMRIMMSRKLDSGVRGLTPFKNHDSKTGKVRDTLLTLSWK